uniref:Putative rna-binding protein n=1 Tax=Corethrella appendiculata TaxID=1370023 RepID=U5EWY7_9DIPT
MKKKHGRHRRKKSKKTSTVTEDEPKHLKNAPHTFVIHRGLPSSMVVAISRDFRHMMEPFTASALKERKSNRIKDFVHLSGFFHVSHMCLFSLSQHTLSLKVARLPKGPTLTFKVHQFTLARDIISATKKQYLDEDTFKNAPLVILNSFSGEGKHLKLMATTFQNMFAAINLTTVKLSSLKRCVLLSYNPVSKLIDLRHYTVSVVPVNINKGVKKIVTRNIPNLSKFDDIADFVEKGHLLSDSEFDDEESHVILPQTLKKGNLEDNKSSLRLHEIGPRLTFQLIKIEDDLMTGEVLYHDYISKDSLEIEELRKKRAEKRRLKEARKQKQEENKVKKDADKAEHKAKTSSSTTEGPSVTDYQKKLLKDAADAVADESDEDDRKYYKEEIGEKPDEELFDGQHKSRKRPFIPKGFKSKLHPAKKPKLDKNRDEDRDNDHRNNKKMNKKGKFGGEKNRKFNNNNKKSMNFKSKLSPRNKFQKKNKK